MTDGINTLRYADFFLAMYFDGGRSCLHRNKISLCKLPSNRPDMVSLFESMTPYFESAHGLIRKGSHKVSEICFEVGFKNLSHFSKIYKEAYNVPPTQDLCLVD